MIWSRLGTDGAISQILHGTEVYSDIKHQGINTKNYLTGIKQLCSLKNDLGSNVLRGKNLGITRFLGQT
jgi:hypothetical protein